MSLLLFKAKVWQNGFVDCSSDWKLERLHKTLWFHLLKIIHSYVLQMSVQNKKVWKIQTFSDEVKRNFTLTAICYKFFMRMSSYFCKLSFKNYVIIINYHRFSITEKWNMVANRVGAYIVLYSGPVSTTQNRETCLRVHIHSLCFLNPGSDMAIIKYKSACCEHWINNLYEKSYVNHYFQCSTNYKYVIKHIK